MAKNVSGGCHWASYMDNESAYTMEYNLNSLQALLQLSDKIDTVKDHQ